jgi:hypothetical protein
MLIVRELRAVDERLQGRLAVAILAGVCPLGIVGLYPDVHVGLHFIERVVQLASEGAGVELVLDALMEALANPVGLGTAGLGARVLDVLQIEYSAYSCVSLLPQYSLPRSVRMRSNGTSCSSNKGNTRSLSISAAVMACLRS